MRAFMALAVLLMGLFAACKTNEEPAPKPQPPLELVIQKGEVTATSATLTVTPSLSEATYVADLYTAEEVGESLSAFVEGLLAEGIASSQFLQDEQQLTFEELHPATDYLLVAFGYSAADKALTTQPEELRFRTAEVELPDLEEAHTLAVDEISWRDAQLTVTPEDEEAEYICGIYPREEYQAKFDNKEQIVEARLSEWKATALQYQDYGYDDPWQFYMQQEQRVGKLTFAASELRNMGWDSEYVIYCFGMDDEGVQSSAVTLLEFETLAPGSSENSFVITIDKTTESSIEFTVTAANDDPYYVSIQQKTYTDYFGPEAEESYEMMIADLVGAFPDTTLGERYIHSGTNQFTNEDFIYTVNALREYRVVVCGFENGPTTEVVLSEVIQPGTTASEEPLTLSLSVDEVEATRVSFTVTPSIASRTYHAGLYTAEEVGADGGAALVERLVAEAGFAEGLYSGTQSLTIEELTPETNHYALAFGYDAEAGELTTEVLLSEQITLPKKEEVVVGDPFLLSVDDITWHDAYLTVKPQQGNSYICGVLSREEFDAHFAADLNQIVEARLSEWKSIAEQYKDYGYDDPWQYYMRQEIRNGERTVDVRRDLLELRWNSDYVAYCFGMDGNGMQTTEVYTVEFSTLAPEPSENSFTVTVTKTTSSSIEFTVTPSNDDYYYVSIQQTSYVDSYGPDMEQSYEDMMYDLTGSYADSILTQRYLYTGEQELNNTSFGTTIRPDRSYKIVVCGFENGPTTEVYFSEEILTPSN